MMRRSAELAAGCEVVTIDWENVSVAALRKLRRQTRISPPPAAIATAQDRVSEKRLFEKLGIATTRWRAVGTRRQLDSAVREIGLPGVLKTRRMGYDGKGQCVLRTPADLERAWTDLVRCPCCTRSSCRLTWRFPSSACVAGAGRFRCIHAITTCTRAASSDSLGRRSAPRALNLLARRHVQTVMEHFRYVGVLTIEFFVRRGAPGRQ